MEFADDGDLAGKIKQISTKREHFMEETIWNWIIQMLEGMKYLHNNNILHRDLKCANIFLTKKGVLKIGDLNVSKVSQSGIIVHLKFGKIVNMIINVMYGQLVVLYMNYVL